MRSLAKESYWAYTTGPLEQTFYEEALLTPEQGGLDLDYANFSMPNQYTSMLDWFAVDLQGEHSAMDGQILKEHTEYVVYAIHRVWSYLVYNPFPHSPFLLCFTHCIYAEYFQLLSGMFS